MYILFYGMTATAGNEIDDENNVEIAKMIIQKVNTGLHYISLAGKDYMTKVSYCKDIDVFISDAGTTSMVPYLFYQKPGVLHWSAGNMPLFKVSHIHKIVEAKYIKFEKGKPLGQASYSMDWKIVYNLTVEVINEIKQVDLPLLRVVKHQELF